MAGVSFDIVGFDLDGTLLDTAADITSSVNFALAAADQPALSFDAVRSMIGGGAQALLIKALDETGGSTPTETARLYRLLLSHYEANIAVHTQPFPGTLDALDALHGMGVKLAVVTNKFEHLAVRLLTVLGMIDRFVTVIGGDTMGTGRAKPAADPIIEMIARCGGGRAAFVGDSSYDTRAARAAGIPSIACSFGFLTGPIGDLAADAVIDGYADLIPALTRLAATLPTNAAPAAVAASAASATGRKTPAA